MLPKKITVAVIKHLPATIGIYIGIIFGLPAFWGLQLGELFALLFYSYICYKALQIMPIKKNMMAWFMIFPMALQQAASINYDAVLIPLCYLFISYMLYLKYEKTYIELRDIMGIILIWGIITYIKIPYILFIILIFILPLDKIHINLGFCKINAQIIKSVMVPISIGAILLVFVGVYIFRKVWFVQIIYGFVIEWKRAIYLLYATGRTWGEFLFVSTVGNLGWLDTPICLGVAIIVFLIVIMFATVYNANDEKHIKLKDALIIEGTAIILCLFITIALTNHTIMVTLYGSEFAEETYEIKEALYQIPYIGGLQGRYYEDKEQEEISGLLNKIEISNENKENNQTERISKIIELKKINKEVVGWLEISGTNINYPVCQSENNDYYLNHTYDGKINSNGSIFLDKSYDFLKPSDNLLIYGHRNKNGLMFDELIKYKDKEFEQEHNIIRFTTDTEDCEYEIMYVFKSRVYYQDENDVFRYYYFINAKNEEEYKYFMDECKKISLYDTGIEAQYGEQLLTLSTCEYSQKNGRFVIVAKKVK